MKKAITRKVKSTGTEASAINARTIGGMYGVALLIYGTRGWT